MPRPPPFARYAGHKKKYNYIPPPSSGAHAILISMLKAKRDEFIQNLTKQQVLDYCTKYSQSAFKDNAKIWSSMKGLIDKSLVGRHISRDPVYFLTEEGKDLAEKLVAYAEGKPLEGTYDEASRETQPSSQPASQALTASQQASNHAFVWCDSESSFELKAGTYDIVLVIDQREKIDIISLDSSIKIETRTLACGDFIWIARPKGATFTDRTKDLVLDYVVERKRLDDLQASLFDGRFEQQKYRLLNTGIRRPVYLIEDFGQLRVTGHITSSGLAQAVVNILTHDGMDVEKVKNSHHANDYLISMTKCLEKFYTNKDLCSCSQERLKNKEAKENEFMTFSEFQTKGAKITNWTVKEMFAKHLIQITGMSDKRVAVIVKKFPTISALNEAYRKCNSEKEKEGLLAKLQIPDSNRTIGPALSKRVYTCYAMPKELRASQLVDDLEEEEDF